MADIQSKLAPLLEGRASRSLDFFLASLVERVWIPRIVVVHQGQRLRGAVFLKERKIGGVGSGVLFGDATLGTMLLAAPEERERVLEAALSHLMDGLRVRGIRLAAPPTGYEPECIRRVCASRSFLVKSVGTVNHVGLTLPDRYEHFLDSLGSRTRRNFRYYRRRAESCGHEYVGQMSWPEFRHAAGGLLKKSVVGAKPEGVDRAFRMFAAAERPVLSGLRDRRGEWLAILGGWQEPGHVMLFMQMNDDRERRADSLSTVLRAYWIESLISKGVGKLLFWAGVSAPLARYCDPVPTERFYLDSRSFAWKAARSLAQWIAPVLPQPALSLADWF